ncbi:hypothetical protein [Shinella sp.]|jgi:hypothetical protein|uniref:hypothetical protein n=1 Tax=Shinella sp. TaxID=1870904 RepID=UPI003F7131D9
MIKALTIWQPWASLILIGAKPYEFRGWKPPASMIGTRIAIHAGARPIRAKEVADLLTALQIPQHFGSPCLHGEAAIPLLQGASKDPAGLPLSHVLCTAILGTPKPGDECAREFGVDAGNDSDRDGTFNWGWPLTEIEPLAPPVPARGAQGFWNWGGDL